MRARLGEDEGDGDGDVHHDNLAMEVIIVGKDG